MNSQKQKMVIVLKSLLKSVIALFAFGLITLTLLIIYAIFAVNASRHLQPDGKGRTQEHRLAGRTYTCTTFLDANLFACTWKEAVWQNILQILFLIFFLASIFRIPIFIIGFIFLPFFAYFYIKERTHLLQGDGEKHEQNKDTP